MSYAQMAGNHCSNQMVSTAHPSSYLTAEGVDADPESPNRIKGPLFRTPSLGTKQCDSLG